MKTKKNYSLEDYIVKKLRENRKNETQAGAKGFSSAISAILNKSRKFDTGYGVLAESLAERGLTASGYSDYIRNTSTDEAKSSVVAEEAKKKLLDAEEMLNEEKLKEERENKLFQLQDKLISYAKKEGITDYNALYEYAIYTGISKDDAKSAAQAAAQEARDDIRQKAILKTRNSIVNKHLTKKQAYELALSLGLGEEDAKELGELAYKMNQKPDYTIERESLPKGGGGGKKPTKIHANY